LPSSDGSSNAGLATLLTLRPAPSARVDCWCRRSGDSCSPSTCSKPTSALWVGNWDEKPRLFKRTKIADEILESRRRPLLQISGERHHFEPICNIGVTAVLLTSANVHAARPGGKARAVHHRLAPPARHRTYPQRYQHRGESHEHDCLAATRAAAIRAVRRRRRACACWLGGLLRQHEPDISAPRRGILRQNEAAISAPRRGSVIGGQLRNERDE
jgi:hypothetical protein